MNENYFNNNNLKDIIDKQNSTINKLKSQIDIYKKQIKEQNEKISSCYHLIIDYNSLYTNYNKLINEITILKKENIQLKSLINSKNKTINEFKSLFIEAKAKFLLFDKLNESYQNKIKYLELQIQLIQKGNNINKFDSKINDYNLNIELIKEKYNNNYDILKNKFESMSINEDNYNVK